MGRPPRLDPSPAGGEVQTKASQLQALVDTAVDGVIQIDVRGTVTLFNPACERLFGYKADEILGQNVKMLMPAPFHAEHDGYLANYHRTGERKIIGIGREVVGRRKDGATFPMELSVGEAVHDGKIVFVGIVHDVSERKRTEEALRESVAQLRVVVDTAVNGVILIDSMGVVRMLNPACERMFGYAAEEVIGENVKKLMPPPFHGEHDAYLANYQRTGERKIIGIGREVVGQRKDGSTFAMELSVGEARQSGEPLFVGIIHDITDRKRAEEQRELFIEQLTASNEERGHFAHVASHDLQQHLRMVSAFTALLSSQYGDSLDEKAREYLSLTLNAAERMRDLVDDLLEYGRLNTEADRTSRFEASASMLQVLESLDEPIRQCGAVITHDPLPAISGNAIRFTRLLQNLVANALKYVEPGTAPRVHVSVQRDGPNWRFSVADNGIGIEESYFEQIFEPFKRLHSKAEYYGTGLGLAICKKIVEGLGGRIWVTSRPGVGSTFCFITPILEGDL
jgi:two-component system sensor kinase FixL